MNRIKLYIVSTYFPPTISIASNRIEAFAKYLDANLFEIEVICLEDSNAKKLDLKGVKITRFSNKAFFSKAEFGKTNNIILHKLKAAYNRLLFYFVDNEYASWQKKVENYLSIQVLQNKNSLILSSFAPSASHLAVLKLKQKGLNFKWIADFRDSMTNPSTASHLLNKYSKIQKQVLETADCVLSVSSPILEEFQSILNTGKQVFKEIRNGYDFELPTKYNFNPVFTMAYVGTFYGKRKPTNFFKAIQLLQQENPEFAFKLNLIGVGSSVYIPIFISENTLVKNKVNHNEALEYMFEADALLLIHPKTAYKGVYTGKIFEYLAALKPIIALVDKDDVAAKLILDCNSGFVSSFDDIEEIKVSIQSAYNLWKNKSMIEVNLDLIKQHHRKVQVERLEKLIIKELT